MDDDFKPAQRPAKSLRASLGSLAAKTPTPETKAFQTPAETAATDDVGKQSMDSTSNDLGTATPGGQPPFHNWRERLKARWKWKFTQREWLVSAVVVLFCGSTVAFILTHVGTKPVASANVEVRKVPRLKVPSTLTGLMVKPEVNERPVTGVMIENSLYARPQSGLSEAGVVFEAIAEGGITRFLALFQDTAPSDVGPIRSARPYYIQWALGFNAAYAHVGGSPEALKDIKAWHVRDLDQFYNSGSYHRIGSREAPHNVYTSIGALNKLESSKGYKHSTYEGFLRKKRTAAKQAPSGKPTAKKIDFKLSGQLYDVHYDYNAATNSYDRSEGGAAHVDANGKKRISPSVVIALVMSYGLESDDHHSKYGTLGSGQAFVFQDGTLIKGHWSKAKATDQFKFTDDAGKPLRLNPGKTWLTAVGSAGNVSLAP